MEKATFLDLASQIFSIGAAAIAAITVSYFGSLAVRSIRSSKIGPLEIEGQIAGSQIEKPFEITVLSNHYNQALSRANISFWFSLIFAAIGFGVIIFAFLTHNTNDIAGTAIKIVSGTIIDAVSALFFVQTQNAQKSMSEFFEKLRLDRLNAEAREMISEIELAERRDQVRTQLIIKYSGIEKLIEGGKN
ncbi:hypothetical protein [Ensifer sp. ZNC0028]|uniref:TRADD-N-associated membrane domain-containing protein n=1 Tax=Ensifer sp. ZNC0028 TaxID=1339236 RepID=UPI00068FFF32|nr:hypothetical protein [Ensifer sp. ZNC0028]